MDTFGSVKSSSFERVDFSFYRFISLFSKSKQYSDSPQTLVVTEAGSDLTGFMFAFSFPARFTRMLASLRNQNKCKLLMDHVIKKCRVNYKYFNCQEKNHYTAICDCLKCIKSGAKETEIVMANSRNKNDKTISMLVDGKTDVLLQTTDCIISNLSETKSLKVKVCLDPRSQITYLSDTVRDFFQLDTINKRNVQIKAFEDMKG